MKQVDIYLEMGKKRVIAGALTWPGWCRSGRDEQSALQALCAYGPRYAKILAAAKFEFDIPQDVAAFNVVERLNGDATTDYGVPGKAPALDERPIGEADQQHYESLLQAYWDAFDAAVLVAKGKELRKGPRGGGRDLDKIVAHIIGADQSYLKRIGKEVELPEDDPAAALAVIRQAVREGLAAGVRGEVPTIGPRGGKRWTARYFVRRSAYHLLDHIWEIEDRIL